LETLTKFGVPLGGGEGRGGLLMPKLKYRFRVRFINFGPIAGGLELTQQVMSMGKPAISYEEVTLDSYNSKAYVHGKHSWDNVTCVLRDDITNTVSKLVGHQVQKQVNHFEQTAFAAGQNYKFTTLTEVMDGGNDVVLEQWQLEGCFLQNVQWGDMDYSQSEPQSISLTIRYDNATQSGGLMPLDGLGFLPGVRA
jgi:hypothetical protein